MSHLRLLISYDGTDFAGFQVQPDVRTVQGVLQDALSEIARERVRIRAAGRTDAGVHALGQVASFPWSGPGPEAVLRALAAKLPPDVGVLDVQGASDDFDARRSALRRSYTYLVWNHEAPHPIFGRYSLWVRDRIDPARLAEALDVVRGTYDFSSFARVRPEQTPVRTVHEAACEPDPPFIRIRVTADAFLHQMVRSIVGSALEVGTGRRPASWMRQALIAGDRSSAGPVAPAQGLSLVEVDYDRAAWPRRPQVPWPWSGRADGTSDRPYERASGGAR